MAQHKGETALRHILSCNMCRIRVEEVLKMEQRYFRLTDEDRKEIRRIIRMTKIMYR